MWDRAGSVADFAARGPFADMIGALEQVDGSGRVQVPLTPFGRETQVRARAANRSEGRGSGPTTLFCRRYCCSTATAAFAVAPASLRRVRASASNWSISYSVMKFVE